MINLSYECERTTDDVYVHTPLGFSVRSEVTHTDEPFSSIWDSGLKSMATTYTCYETPKAKPYNVGSDHFFRLSSSWRAPPSFHHPRPGDRSGGFRRAMPWRAQQPLEQRPDRSPVCAQVPAERVEHPSVGVERLHLARRVVVLPRRVPATPAWAVTRPGQRGGGADGRRRKRWRW